MPSACRDHRLQTLPRGGVERVGALTGGELNVGDVSLDAAVFLDLRAELVKLA
ncbi:MAG: hypothetical protein ACLRSD_13210 [Oscillibacter sp.]